LPGSPGGRIILDVAAPPPADDIAPAALALARAAVERYVRTGLVGEPPGPLGGPGGSLVTLRLGGRLRGCVGTLAPTRPDIAWEIAASAIAAASTDPRFSPVRTAELAPLDYEVAQQVGIAWGKAGLAPGAAARLSRFTVRRYRESP
jgi:hypothetical protein